MPLSTNSRIELIPQRCMDDARAKAVHGDLVLRERAGGRLRQSDDCELAGATFSAKRLHA